MLYHGTNKVFTTPDIEAGRDGMDFGKGFYLTPNLETARKMAVRVAFRAFQYSFHTDEALSYLRYEGVEP